MYKVLFLKHLIIVLFKKHHAALMRNTNEVRRRRSVKIPSRTGEIFWNLSGVMKSTGLLPF